jgi:hypothetical protein
MDKNSKDNKDGIKKAFGDLEASDKKEVAIGILNRLDNHTRNDVIQQSGLGAPDQRYIDNIWLIVVGAIALILILTTLGLIYAVVFAGKNAGDVQVVVTLFTAAIGFLGGLFVPSPSQNNKGQGK